MNYTKPEVAVLGDAAQVIQLVRAKLGTYVHDGGLRQFLPAYDLDE